MGADAQLASGASVGEESGVMAGWPSKTDRAVYQEALDEALRKQYEFEREKLNIWFIGTVRGWW